MTALQMMDGVGVCWCRWAYKMGRRSEAAEHMIIRLPAGLEIHVHGVGCAVVRGRCMGRGRYKRAMAVWMHNPTSRCGGGEAAAYCR
jgi:hypothetical protein